MQRLQINEKAVAQSADFASREGDPVRPLQVRPDLLALTMVNKALQPDMNHNVVTGNALGQQEFRKIQGPRGHEPAFLLAPGSADMHRLANAKRTVSQGHPSVLNRLLHSHADAADRAHPERARQR